MFNLLVVLGPTASGKTHLGVELARAWNGEIISADSRQVYRGLNLGAGKDLQEYEPEGLRIPYHLIDIADLNQEFSVFDFQKEFFNVFLECGRRQVLPILVGGTGLYLEAVLKNYALIHVPENPELRRELSALSDPELEKRLRLAQGRLHNTTDTSDRQRLLRAIEIALFSQNHPAPPVPEVRPLILGVRWERVVLRRRIAERLQARLAAGLVAEVAGLHRQGVPWERLQRLGLEYRYVAEHLQSSQPSEAELFRKLHLAICDFAKRQETWFRRMERQGTVVHWVDQADYEQANRLVTEIRG